MPYFPDVATFELLHYNNKNFAGAVKRHRNVLFLSIDQNHKESKGTLQYKENVWANGQLVIEIIAKDYPQLTKDQILACLAFSADKERRSSVAL